MLGSLVGRFVEGPIIGNTSGRCFLFVDVGVKSFRIILNVLTTIILDSFRRI